MNPSYLHIYNRNDALGLVKMPGNPVDRLRDEVQHEVEIDFIFLCNTGPREIFAFRIYICNRTLQTYFLRHPVVFQFEAS